MNRIYLTNFKTYSSNNSSAQIDSIEIENGRISKIGLGVNVLPAVKRNCTIINLNGAVVLPGFTDSHIHLLAYGQSLQRVNCNTPTKEECLLRIAVRAKETPPGKWVIGHGWDHNLWENGYGSKADLDRISGEHPIYLSHKSLHSGWANSAALHLAGIFPDTPDPGNGHIVRDMDHTPTGIVLEGAMKMVEDAVPEHSEREILEALKIAQHDLNRFGITAVHDFDPWQVYTALNALQNSQELTLRVTKGIPEPFLTQAIEMGLTSGCGSDWVKIGWLKLFADGALGPQTAAMLSPYKNSTSIGMLSWIRNGWLNMAVWHFPTRSPWLCMPSVTAP